MLLSIWPGMSQPWAAIAETAQFADDGGWHCLYVEDHFFDWEQPDLPLHEVTSTLGALAALTHRIRLAPLVLSVTHRHPAVLANWAATVDHVSAGRLTLGLGAGWAQDEHTAYGLALGTPRERVDRFAEALAVVDGVLHHPPYTLDGRFFQVAAATAPPGPLGARIPLLVGAKGDRMLALVARYADEWNAWSSPELLTELTTHLDAACERAGRDPRTLHRSTQALVKVTDDPREARAFAASAGPRAAVAGTADHVAERLAGYAAAGADEFIVLTEHFGDQHEREDTLAALWEATADLRGGAIRAGGW